MTLKTTIDIFSRERFTTSSSNQTYKICARREGKNSDDKVWCKGVTFLIHMLVYKSKALL